MRTVKFAASISKHCQQVCYRTKDCHRQVGSYGDIVSLQEHLTTENTYWLESTVPKLLHTYLRYGHTVA